MCEKTLCGVCSLETREENKIKFNYYIIEKPQSNGKCYYGIKVTQEDKKTSISSKEIMLSEYKIFVMDILYKLIRNKVTLVTLEYIIDDIMEEVPC